MHVYTTIEEYRNGDITDPSGLVETELLIQFETDPIVKARLCGPPEDCHPEEGGDVRITEIFECIGDEEMPRPELMRVEKADPDLWSKWEHLCDQEAREVEHVGPDFDWDVTNSDLD